MGTTDREGSMNSAESRLLELSLQHIQQDTKRLSDAVDHISQSLSVLPAMQQSQVNIQFELARGSNTMADHEKRIQQVERDMPGLKELRRWVIGGVLAGIGLVGTALFKLVIVDVPRFAASPNAVQPAVKQTPP